MPESKKVRLGVIGAGGISQVSHIPNILAEKSADLVAVCDSDPARASGVSERFGIPVWFDQPEELFRHTALDGVVIATPTISHVALTRLAFENGVDVMIEKPFARTTAEGRAIVEAAAKFERLIIPAMNHRFRADVIHLRRVLARQELGDLTMIRAGWLKQLGVWGRPLWFTDRRLSGGGVLMDLGLQMIDLVLFLTGFPTPIETFGAVSDRALDLGVEDTATGFIRFEEEFVLQLEVSWANCDDHDKAYTWFSGTHGAAALNPIRLSRRQKDAIEHLHLPNFGDEVKLYRNSFRTEIAHFIECIRKRQQPLSTGVEAVAALEIVEKIYRSAGI